MANFVGGTEDNLFTLNIGDGASTISDAGGVDKLVFGPNITPSMVTYSRIGNDLIIKYGATDSVRIANHFDVDSSGNPLATRIESLMFKGGWTVDLWSGITIKETGTAAGDLMLGSYARDILFGEFGNDTLMGFDGNDILSSAADADVVYGGNGMDLIYGGGGADLLSGDAGDDTVYGDGGNDTLNGGAGNDTLDGGINNDIMTGGEGNDLYVVDSAADQVVELADEGVDTIQTSMTYSLGATVENLTLTGAANINGTGNAGNNAIVGNAGNNILDGAGGVDAITAGAGNDQIVVTAGVSQGIAEGNAGTDVLVLNLTSGQITPEVRADLQGFAAWMESNLASVGGDVAALAAQATGATFTFAALGLTVSTVEGIRLMVDGVEHPLADYLNTAPVIETTSIQGNEDEAITGVIAARDADNNPLTFSVMEGPSNGSLTLDAATGAYSYQGSSNWSGTDQFTVTVDDGRGGVTSETIGVTVAAVADAPTLAVSVTTRTATGQVITGSTRSDTIVGGYGADTISGGSGDDVITGDPEDTYVMGLEISGALVDTDGSEQLSFSIANLPADAVLSAGVRNSDGSWSLTSADLAGLSLTTAEASPFQMTITATSTEGTNASTAATSIVIDPTIGLGETAYGNKGADIINAGNGNDLVYGNSGNDTIHGDSGNDRLYGGTGDDKVYGDTGNDTLYGGKGHDALDGGSGDDLLHGNTGNDVVNGGVGSDIVWGDEGNDTLSDGSGNDKVVAGSGDDRVIVGSGNDTFDGSSGFDTLDFSQASTGVVVNAVLGLASGEGLDAFAGFESFVGSNYGDVLIGGAVGERMQGGFGADIMSGGAGGDTFAWSRGDVFTTAGAVSGVDHITDFNLSADTIDMRGALAGGTLAARDTAAGTVLSVLGAAGPAVDVVVLDGVHGINTAALASADWLLQ